MEGICTSSQKFQAFKLADLEAIKDGISADVYDKMKFDITEKACLCVGLANAAYLENDIKIKGQAQGVVICPGPNMAYFDKEVSLSDMVKHIYGNAMVMTDVDRPNFFIKELKMYVDYLIHEINGTIIDLTTAQIKKWNAFKNNLLEGIEYYQALFSKTNYFKQDLNTIQKQLHTYKAKIEAIEIPEFTLV